jgi:hypothetical protein
MLQCGNIVLLTVRFLEMVKFTTLGPLLLVTSCTRPRVAVAHSGEMEEHEEDAHVSHMFNFTMLVGIQSNPDLWIRSQEL